MYLGSWWKVYVLLTISEMIVSLHGKCKICETMGFSFCTKKKHNCEKTEYLLSAKFVSIPCIKKKHYLWYFGSFSLENTQYIRWDIKKDICNVQKFSSPSLCPSSNVDSHQQQTVVLYVPQVNHTWLVGDRVLYYFL